MRVSNVIISYNINHFWYVYMATICCTENLILYWPLSDYSTYIRHNHYKANNLLVYYQIIQGWFDILYDCMHWNTTVCVIACGCHGSGIHAPNETLK